MGIVYCLNDISQLLHLIRTPMVSHLYLYSIVLILCDTNYRHLSLSQLHFAITSSDDNTPLNTFYNNYVINICPRLLL